MRYMASMASGAAVAVLAATLAGAAAAAAVPAIVDRSAKLRSGPGAGYQIVATLPRGTAVDVRGCRVGWCEIVWSGGRGYIGQTLLVLAGMPSALAAPAGAGHEDGYDYPGFDYPGTAYAPTFSMTTVPRWSHRRWMRGQRAANWRALPPQITAPAGRSPDRTSVRGTATTPPPFVPVGSFGDTRPTVGSTPSDASLPAPARAAVPAPPVPPLPIPSGPAVERR